MINLRVIEGWWLGLGSTLLIDGSGFRFNQIIWFIYCNGLGSWTIKLYWYLTLIEGSPLMLQDNAYSTVDGIEPDGLRQFLKRQMIWLLIIHLSSSYLAQLLINYPHISPLKGSNLAWGLPQLARSHKNMFVDRFRVDLRVAMVVPSRDKLSKV